MTSDIIDHAHLPTKPAARTGSRPPTRASRLAETKNGRGRAAHGGGSAHAEGTQTAMQLDKMGGTGRKPQRVVKQRVDTGAWPYACLGSARACTACATISSSPQRPRVTLRAFFVPFHSGIWIWVDSRAAGAYTVGLGTCVAFTTDSNVTDRLTDLRWYSRTTRMGLDIY